MLDKNENMEKPSIRPSLHDTPKAPQQSAAHSVLDAAIGMQNQKQQTRTPVPPKNNRPSLVMGALFVALCAGTVLYKNWPVGETTSVSQSKPSVSLAEQATPAKPEAIQAAPAAAPEQPNVSDTQPSPFAELTKQDERPASTESSPAALSPVIQEGVQEAALEPVSPPISKQAPSIKRQAADSTPKPRKAKVATVSNKSQKTSQKSKKSGSKKAMVKTNAKGSAANKNLVQSKPRPVVLASASTKTKKHTASTDSDVKLFEALITQIRKQEKTAQADHADTTANLKQ
jgi:hypothetical protein